MDESSNPCSDPIETLLCGACWHSRFVFVYRQQQYNRIKTENENISIGQKRKTTDSIANTRGALFRVKRNILVRRQRSKRSGKGRALGSTEETSRKTVQTFVRERKAYKNSNPNENVDAWRRWSGSRSGDQCRFGLTVVVRQWIRHWPGWKRQLLWFRNCFGVIFVFI